jgi:hypothetical protein
MGRYTGHKKDGVAVVYDHMVIRFMVI